MIIVGVLLLLNFCKLHGILCAVRQSPTSEPYVMVHDNTFFPDKILRITKQNMSMDCTTRESVVINGSIPGPELRFKEGQHVWVRVYNDIEDENVTIHWHGLSQRMSPFSDGSPMVSQWPIPPMHYFDYEFQLQPGDAGTYFYHSHVGFQAVTATGALIVDEAAGKVPPYQYDEERIIVLTDVYHWTDKLIETRLTGTPFMPGGNPNNVAVNGKSRSQNATVDEAAPSCELAVINIQPNKAYRLRIVGALAHSFVYFTFESHQNMVLIEVDGKYVMPHVVDHLEVSSGQRYSVMLYSKSVADLTSSDGTVKSRFWMQLETHPMDNKNNTLYAILHYTGVGDSGPVDTFTLPLFAPVVMAGETFADGWLEDQLQPFYPESDNPFIKLEEITRRIYVNLMMNVDPQRRVTFINNGAPWFENTPQEPYLVSLYKNNTKYFPDYDRAIANGGFDNVTTTFPAKVGEVLEIIWYLVSDQVNQKVETHPWHSHGDHYWDAGTGPGTYDPVANEAKLTARHGRIITRDTSNTYRPATAPEQMSGPNHVYSWRSFRIRVKNPGVWMMHCHMLQHMIMGMQTVWVFGEAKDVTPLPNKLIDAGYLVYGGTSYGNASYAPRVLHFW